MPQRQRTTTPKLYERVLDVLSDEIRNGQLPEGERLTEVALAARFGISRAPIRQSLILLTERGLASKLHSTGYVVTKPKTSEQSAQTIANTAKALPLTTRSSWEIIYNDVEKEIVSRAPFASWHVNEVALASHYGVSRTISRDVLARLQQRGIVIKDNRGRWQAPALDEKRLNELYELRSVLEPLALGKAALKIPTDVIQFLRGRLVEVIGQKKSSDYPSKLDTLEQDMHVTLLGFCDNRTLLEAISLPQAMLVTQHFLYDWTNDMFDSEPFLPEHLEVYDYLITGDVAAAQAALAHHLNVSRSRSLQRIEKAAGHIKLQEMSYLKRQ